ncbi:MAG: hypothetical protein HYU02_06100 [Thaumarchaeota archaeon]|nr:hypothetical protein [Nitrososphaerota archaeon]
MLEKRAILVTYPDTFAKQEAIGLAEPVGFKVTNSRRVTQNHGKFGVGSVKTEELKQIADETNSADIIVD